MRIKNYIQDAIKELMSDISDGSNLAHKFTWKGVSVSCLPSFLNEGSAVMRDGVEVTLTVVLHVLVSDFLTVDSTFETVDSVQVTVDLGAVVPVVGKTVTFRNKKQRILASGLDASGAYLKLTLGDPNQ